MAYKHILFKYFGYQIWQLSGFEFHVFRNPKQAGLTVRKYNTLMVNEMDKDTERYGYALFFFSDTAKFKENSVDHGNAILLGLLYLLVTKFRI